MAVIDGEILPNTDNYWQAYDYFGWTFSHLQDGIMAAGLLF